MERLTFEGNFCDIAQCREVPGGSFCEDGACSQKKVWERLKAYEDTGLTPEGVRAVLNENDAEIMDAAKSCICGQREEDYGTPEDNSGVIADLWNSYMRERREWRK